MGDAMSARVSGFVSRRVRERGNKMVVFFTPVFGKSGRNVRKPREITTTSKMFQRELCMKECRPDQYKPAVRYKREVCTKTKKGRVGGRTNRAPRVKPFTCVNLCVCSHECTR